MGRSLARQAARARAATMFHEGVAHLWTTTTSDLDELGVGVALYFRLVKYLSVLFWLLTLLLLPSALLYYCGDGLGGDVDMFNFARITPSNFVEVGRVSVRCGVCGHCDAGGCDRCKLWNGGSEGRATSRLTSRHPVFTSAYPLLPLAVHKNDINIYTVHSANRVVAEDHQSKYVLCTGEKTSPSSLSLNRGVRSLPAASRPVGCPCACVGVHCSGYNMGGMMIVLFDMVICTAFLVFVVYLKMRIETITKEMEGTQITAADYSVLVRGLPPNATKEDIVDHFDGLYNLAEKDWTFPGFCLCIGRKTRRRPKQITAASKAAKVRVSEHDADECDAYQLCGALVCTGCARGEGGLPSEGSCSRASVDGRGRRFVVQVMPLDTSAPSDKDGHHSDADKAAGGKRKKFRYHLKDNLTSGPVLNAVNTRDPLYLRTYVADVSIAYKNGDSIERFRAKAAQLQRVRATGSVACRDASVSRSSSESEGRSVGSVKTHGASYSNSKWCCCCVSTGPHVVLWPTTLQLALTDPRDASGSQEVRHHVTVPRPSEAGTHHQAAAAHGGGRGAVPRPQRLVHV